MTGLPAGGERKKPQAGDKEEQRPQHLITSVRKYCRALGIWSFVCADCQPQHRQQLLHVCSPLLPPPLECSRTTSAVQRATKAMRPPLSRSKCSVGTSQVLQGAAVVAWWRFEQGGQWADGCWPGDGIAGFDCRAPDTMLASSTAHRM